MNSGNANLLTLGGNVLGSQHGGVWGGLVSVGLDLHTTSNSGDGLSTGQIGDVDESIVEGSVDTGNTENLGTVSRHVDGFWLILREGFSESDGVEFFVAVSGECALLAR